MEWAGGVLLTPVPSPSVCFRIVSFSGGVLFFPISYTLLQSPHPEPQLHPEHLPSFNFAHSSSLANYRSLTNLEDMDLILVIPVPPPPVPMTTGRTMCYYVITFTILATWRFFVYRSCHFVLVATRRDTP